MLRSLAGFVLCATAIVWASVAQAENWPRWRGADGMGHASAEKLPVKWTADDVAWKVDLPGEGQSSPVVWEDRIFLTSSQKDGKERCVFCLDRKTGKLLWQQCMPSPGAEPLHKMNTWASATCATDGERVVAFFGLGGLHCFDMDGKKLWSRDLGVFEGPWGTAASPVIVGDLVVQNCDADDSAYLLAVNKETGEDVWRTERPTYRGWSTPILSEVNGAKQLVINGHVGIAAYDPETGKELWTQVGSSGRGTPSVVKSGELFIAVCGRPGDMVAANPFQPAKGLEAWRVKRSGGRDLSSPIVVGDYLFVMNMTGIGTCYDAQSGELLWIERIGGNFSASPIESQGLIYLPAEDGSVLVLKPGKTLDVVAQNSVGAGGEEMFRASLTPHNGQLLLRSNNALYCIGK
ncbi:outer membrane protein assembly factor BamB family protein [Lignipirellula cremea]|uniref:Outer membrane biogenesis protein BamB n=1 Tax=Lignipirellula cremea TaxID=2528010 RepID=A0A518E2N7_9BACT|nr:PQQ-binding-like beta-propeller repeat protein [Lignipirellula cremea]QDU98358.1 outer membrane biogenesis protein BamB [Lignipirellula cremea]